MAAKTKKLSKQSPARRKANTQVIVIPGMAGVQLIRKSKDTVLELRDRLGVTQEFFAQLVDVSVRTIAEVEANPKPVKKLFRNYAEVKRLCDALGEIVEPNEIPNWLKTPNDALDGFKPIEVIERGEIDRLWEMLFRLRSGMPG